ncbi:MAG TPA: hypothetical protein VGB89_13605, partial [Bacteroidota bacterium]
ELPDFVFLIRPSHGTRQIPWVKYILLLRNLQQQHVMEKPKLLDQVRIVCRLKHYSRRAEDAYVHWIRYRDLSSNDDPIHTYPDPTSHQSMASSLLRSQRRASPLSERV